MKKKISKNEAKEKIEKFFLEIKNKTPKEIKRIKNLSSNQKISLKGSKNLFCKNCLTPFQNNEKIRIKKESKTTECKNCGKINRFRI
ncbi:hypothetical protein COU58_02620 [Candidatus Pacearchaeota archaeon CG10_big_fil_rev_8_21_14_0_10_32_42]|nr:MAG: hypothetical protein COU58_02620 [Candidatus Pacearchaeota archaeon CG10_big_fil_rev_8_21_14_0_10_32_42]